MFAVVQNSFRKKMYDLQKDLEKNQEVLCIMMLYNDKKHLIQIFSRLCLHNFTFQRRKQIPQKDYCTAFRQPR